MTDPSDNPQIRAILAEQDAFRAAPPSLIPRMARSVSRPVGFLTNRLIPAEMVEAALLSADWAAGASIRKAAITHDFADLTACEEAAADIRRWALGYAVTGGGAAGAFGLLGLAVDVPATITLALRTVRLTGLCYGFGADSRAEKVFILDVLGLAGANSRDERQQAIARLAREQADMAPDTWTKIVRLSGQSAGSLAATRRVAATLGVNLSTRKMAQLAPVIGAAVGASVNAAFQNDVAAAARFAYRNRWLAENEALIDGEILSGDPV
ncbi:EcsC family protein [Oceanibium sediminis]|uniref:EcsC family protein n=1 Tax=Oceanibium sediminis TaxID=2026339 RepID=UPI00130064DB|nr:EcsC family protein [Oceanibium sediminis]